MPGQGTGHLECTGGIHVCRKNGDTGPGTAAVHKGEAAFKVYIFPAGQGAALRADQHIPEIQLYLVLDSHENTQLSGLR